MQLIQARVQCVKGVGDTGWFVPGRETTVIHGPPGGGVSQLIQALQALNPLYEIPVEDPFAAHPKVWTQGEYTRRVIPEKKTAVFMVYSAEPELVHELEKIDPVLLETDRIEVGRRLDYSSWITFVEISASTRWSEISNEMQEISEHLGRLDDPSATSLEDAFPGQMRGTDRIKGTTYEACKAWLVAATKRLPDSDRPLIDSCLYQVERVTRFQQARKKIEEWLPPTIYLHPEPALQSGYQLSEIFDDNSSFDPVMSLLRLLCQRYSLHEPGGAGRGSLMADLERERPFLQALLPGGIALPALDADGEQIIIRAHSSQNIIEERLQLIAMVCLLAVLTRGQLPLLLLDRFDRGLSAEETVDLAAGLQQLGRHCQLIISTESELLASADGWQKVQLVGPEGLAGGGSVTEKQDLTANAGEQGQKLVQK